MARFKIENFFRILSLGLKISPIEFHSISYLFGPGIYFSNYIYKAIKYCGNNNSL